MIHVATHPAPVFHLDLKLVEEGREFGLRLRRAFSVKSFEAERADSGLLIGAESRAVLASAVIIRVAGARLKVIHGFINRLLALVLRQLLEGVEGLLDLRGHSGRHEPLLFVIGHFREQIGVRAQGAAVFESEGVQLVGQRLQGALAVVGGHFGQVKRLRVGADLVGGDFGVLGDFVAAPGNEPHQRDGDGGEQERVISASWHGWNLSRLRDFCNAGMARGIVLAAGSPEGTESDRQENGYRCDAVNAVSLIPLCSR